MATEIWRKFPHLIEDILANGPSYHFYQAVRLATTLFADNSEDHQGLASKIRLKAAPQLSFPAGDIRNIRLDEQGRLELSLNFMGLYGVDSPLPHFFIEAATGEEDQAKVFRAFLDIFNRRTYELLYRGWEKFQPPCRENSRHIASRYLAAFAGNMQAADEPALLGFAGTLGNRVKNSAGLQGLIHDFLGQVAVEIKEFVGCWVTIDNHSQLGGRGAQALSLGENCILGERILDISRKIEVVIGPMSSSAALDLLPGKNRAQHLGSLIKQYLPLTTSFDVELLVRPDTDQLTPLGSTQLMLGWNTCLGRWQEGLGRIRIPGQNFMAPHVREQPETEKPLAKAA